MIKVFMPSIISLGKGEVESSILSCSTIFLKWSAKALAPRDDLTS